MKTETKILNQAVEVILLDMWYAAWWRDCGICGIISNKELCIEQSEELTKHAQAEMNLLRMIPSFSCNFYGGLVDYTYRGIAIKTNKSFIEYISELENTFQHPKDELSYEI